VARISQALRDSVLRRQDKKTSAGFMQASKE